MAKRKDAIALFEVIAKGREKRSAAGLNIPQWMGHPTAPSASAPPQAAPAPAGPCPAAGGAPAPAAVRPSSPPAASSAGEAVISYGEDPVV